MGEINNMSFGKGHIEISYYRDFLKYMKQVLTLYIYSVKFELPFNRAPMSPLGIREKQIKTQCQEWATPSLELLDNVVPYIPKH